jgi:predicted transcriptional regulator
MAMAERQTTVRLSEETWRRLRRRAFELEVSQNSIIEEAIERALADESTAPEYGERG